MNIIRTLSPYLLSLLVLAGCAAGGGKLVLEDEGSFFV
jgi:hypothetical protein